MYAIQYFILAKRSTIEFDLIVNFYEKLDFSQDELMEEKNCL
jgi:hypothetical protein